MSIVKLQPDVAPPIVNTTPDTIQEPNKSIFTSLVPESRITSLLKYVEGYPWTVNFYGQILNKNNTLEGFDPSTPNLTQPYYEVVKLILQVSSPLSSNYDQATGITTVTGGALVPYGLTPNVGDIFIASVDSGEDAIFVINTVSRKTFRKDTIYEISYNLFSYTSTDPSFVTTLKSRIQDTYFFNKDTNFFNRDALIKPSVKEATDRLKNLLRETQEYYFHTFAQKESGGILIPGVSAKVYDPLLLNFLAKIVDYNDLADVPFFRHNYSENRYINQPSLYDVLFSRNISMLNVINKDYVFIPSADLPNRARFGTIFHTGANYVLFPKNPNTKTDIDALTTTSVIIEFIEEIKTTKNYFLPNLPIQTKSNDTVFTKQVLHEMFVNDSYIVSEHFYNYVTNNATYNEISYLELLIFRHINKEAIAKEDLVLAIEKYHSWSLIHQLYLLPILWFLIKVNL